MSVRSPLHDHGASRDPYQLERLAEELATRELAHPDVSHAHDLPLYIPLSHNDPFLAADSFDVERFLLSRSHTSLADLRSELRDYLASLKEELVKLINDDYEAFISLSTDLRGEGVRLNKLKSPLGTLKSQVIESKTELHVLQAAIQAKLEERTILREEKALLHLLLKISDSVTRLESLLLIASPDEGVVGSPEINGLRLPAYLSNDKESVDTKSRGNRAKHLGRVAAEYTQLLYHASKARAERCVFVDGIQWRIDRIHSTLSSDLDHLFGSILIALTDGKGEGRVPDIEKAKWIADLTECLRTYDILSLWRDAEDVLRREIVRGFVKKTIYSGALTTPHSPIAPHTPLPPSRTPGFASSTLLQPPRTPYTPFTPFISSKWETSQSDHSFSTTSLPQVYLLEDHDDPLARLYNQILRFIERDLSRIMDIAEKVSIRSISVPRAEKGTSTSEKFSKADGGGFEIMGNVIWDEIGRTIMDELGSFIFAAGQPNDFRKHHEITQAFIRSLELLAPSLHSVEFMRAHPVYSAFAGRWQLPVYFQLRWKEIIGKLEEALSVIRIDPFSSKDENAFGTSQATAVWISISACWSAEIFIPDLSHRFWRLTLQILSRYKTWLDQCLSVIDHAAKISAPAPLTTDKHLESPSSISRTSTSTGEITAESTASDDALLRQYSAIMVDIRAMQSNVLTMWREEISMMLPETFDSAGGDGTNTEDALRHVLSNITSLTPPMSAQILKILIRRCCDALLPVRSIPSQFRAMSDKRPPVEPSYFVSSIFRPLKLFFGIGVGEGPGMPLRDEFLAAYAVDIFESISQRYVYYLSAMKKKEESLKRLKKGKKIPFSLFGPANPGQDDERDEERIRIQMVLDVEAFGKEAESLGIDTATNESFRALKEMVNDVTDMS